MFSLILLSLSLYASSAFATVFITSPTATSTLTGGQQTTVSWQDNGASPNLAQFGDAKLSIFTGNARLQTLLQEITSSVNVATTSSIQFTPDPSIGPNGNEYFIRIESLNFKDPSNPQFPALSFSSKFTMNNMRGTFNSTVQAQIDGQSTAPIGGTSTASASSTSSSSSNSTSRSSSAITSTSDSGQTTVVVVTASKASSTTNNTATSSSAAPSSSSQSSSADNNANGAGSVYVGGPGMKRVLYVLGVGLVPMIVGMV